MYVRCTGELARELQDQESRDEMVSRRGRTGVNEVRTTAEVFSMRFALRARKTAGLVRERGPAERARRASRAVCDRAFRGHTSHEDVRAACPVQSES